MQSFLNARLSGGALSLLVTCWLLFLPVMSLAQPVNAPISPKVMADSAVAMTDTMPQQDTIYIDNGITEAEMNSSMMTTTKVVEATPSLANTIFDWIFDHYAIAPLLILAVVAAFFWIVKKIHRLTL